MAVQDLFPVAEGTYALTVLLQNAVGKEFSLFEKDDRRPGRRRAGQVAHPSSATGSMTRGPTIVPFKFPDASS